MSNPMVGCEVSDGILKIHPESEYCEVCEHLRPMREAAARPKPVETFCIDCGQPTAPGKGSARCPGCWSDRCQSYE
jgi:hypothetical protein